MLCAGRAARADRGRVLEHRNTEINTAESVHLCNVWQVGRSAADKLDCSGMLWFYTRERGVITLILCRSLSALGCCGWWAAKECRNTRAKDCAGTVCSWQRLLLSGVQETLCGWNPDGRCAISGSVRTGTEPGSWGCVSGLGSSQLLVVSAAQQEELGSWAGRQGQVVAGVCLSWYCLHKFIRMIWTSNLICALISSFTSSLQSGACLLAAQVSSAQLPWPQPSGAWAQSTGCMALHGLLAFLSSRPRGRGPAFGS